VAPPPIATPGLSQARPGQGVRISSCSKAATSSRAPSTATLKEKWDDAGGRPKLKQAVQAAGGKFVGPLPSPYEALALHLQGRGGDRGGALPGRAAPSRRTCAGDVPAEDIEHGRGRRDAPGPARAGWRRTTGVNASGTNLPPCHRSRSATPKATDLPVGKEIP